MKEKFNGACLILKAPRNTASSAVVVAAAALLNIKD